MAPDERELLRPVAQAMRAGKGKVLVDAGLSMQSGLGSWFSVLAPSIKEGLGIDLVAGDDLPEIAQFYANTVAGGKHRLVAAVAADVNSAAAPSAAHLALGRLPVAECWTTNFDSLLELTFPGHKVVEGDAALIDASRGQAPMLIKMHGSLPNARPTLEQAMAAVLTRDDFEEYQDKHPRLWSRLAANYLSGSMLLLGLSLTDPSMRLLLRLARAAEATGVDSSSVVVMKQPGEEQEALRFAPRVADLADSGVSVLTIPTYQDLERMLERLRAQLRPPRVILSGSARERPDPESHRVIEAAKHLGLNLRNGLSRS